MVPLNIVALLNISWEVIFNNTIHCNTLFHISLNNFIVKLCCYCWSPLGNTSPCSYTTLFQSNITFCYFLHCRDKFPKEKIPTLEEVVELCSSLELKMIIEIKRGSQVLEVSSLHVGNVFPEAHSDKCLFQVSFFNKFIPA